MTVVEATVARYRWVALAVAFTCQFANALASQSIAPLAPLFQSELGLTNAEVGFFSSAAYAGAWGVLLIAGSFTDRHGVRKMLSFGQLLIGAFMLSMAAVGTFLQAVAVMFGAGVGRGVTSPGVTKAIMDWFQPRARATAMGIKQTGVPAAGILTASTLPAIALVHGWRAAVGLVGFLVLAGALATALLYRDFRAVDAPAQGRPSMRAGLRQVIRIKLIWLISGISLMYVTVQLGLTTYLALYLKQVVLLSKIPDMGTRVVTAGAFLALCQGGGVFGRVFWGVVSDRLFHGRRLVVMAVIGALMAVFSLVVAWLDPGLPLWLLSAIVFLYGTTAIGWNGLYQAVMAESAGRRYAATGVGLGMTLTQAGTVGGPPLFGFVVDVAGTFQTAWMMLSALSLTGMAIAIYCARGERGVENE
ncbi:MAG: MFS transporter [Chloroflexota bacterium]